LAAGEPLRANPPTLLTWAQKIAEIRAVAIFGSYAKGTARRNSDIDLFIIESAADSLEDEIERHAAWKAELCDVLGVPKVDIYGPRDEHAFAYAREANVIIYDPDESLTKILA
jgi:predicted nucleotidyltransferase